MELEAFLQHVKERKPLNTPEIYEFMNRASDEARRITFEQRCISFHARGQRLVCPPVRKTG